MMIRNSVVHERMDGGHKTEVFFEENRLLMVVEDHHGALVGVFLRAFVVAEEDLVRNLDYPKAYH
jgi:hypothetical protein